MVFGVQESHTTTMASTKAYATKGLERLKCNEPSSKWAGLTSKVAYLP